ncbi:MAG TPA: pseudouridine synthase [Povalibacter sp.]
MAGSHTIRAAMKPFLNIAAYKFLPLSDLQDKRSRLLSLCESHDLRGSILLSPEGINLFVAGEAEHVELLLAELRSWPGLEDLQPKVSGTERQPFRRMLVRVKKEIIAFGVAGIDPARRTSPKLPAIELKRWLDEGRPVTLLDTRNDYEVKLGTFRNALPIGIGHFRDFPAAVGKLPEQLKEQPLVMFCTGGIRCEKAGPFMEREGFTQVFQLDGGILKYFEECGNAHYDGECFVFDQRTGIDARLEPTRSTQCFNCRLPLNETDQQHEHYVPGTSCPYCYKTPAEQMAAILDRRHEHVRRIITPLPGSQPHDHYRPVNVPAECDGQRLIDALCSVVAHVPAEIWLDRCARGLLLDTEGNSCAPDRIVRAGQRYRHRFPAVIEPDVNMQIELLHEDEALFVVNKPAPLPMHAGGRFYRNTLKYVLDALYHPQKPRPSHRLDANTTGAVVVARTQFVAKKIQTQFARGEVEKIYLVQVQGHPATDEFSCDAPISAEAGKLGSRSIDHEAGLPSRTEFRVQRRNPDGTALLEARPLTGRTNQIRVHLWHLGLPVCGDPAYLKGNVLGDSQTLEVAAPPLCLHAWKISFRHPLHRQLMTITAPAPVWAAGPQSEFQPAG